MLHTQAPIPAEPPLVHAFQIHNANIFNGETFYTGDINIADDGTLSSLDPATNCVIDGTNKYLIPGLIDSHIHLRGGHHILEKLARNGVTTGLDMGVIPKEYLDSLREQSGLPDIRSAGPPATSPGSGHSKIEGLEDYLISHPDDAHSWVSARVDEGSDYIKIIADVPGPSQGLIDAITHAAHDHGKVVVVHAMRNDAYQMGINAGVDFMTHLPLDKPLTPTQVKQIKEKGIVAIPTLAILEALPAIKGGNFKYENAVVSFRALHDAGVPILAGSDSNAEATCPLEHGVSFHRELKLMVDAGFEPAEVMRSCMSGPSQSHGDVFHVADRGRIEEGLRADLVLLGKNPVQNIENISSIERVWIKGVEFERD